MNRIFKTIWNTVRKCLVVVKETTKSAAQSSSAGGSVVDQSVAYSSKTTGKHSKHTFIPLIFGLGVLGFSPVYATPYWVDNAGDAYSSKTVGGDVVTDTHEIFNVVKPVPNGGVGNFAGEINVSSNATYRITVDNSWLGLHCDSFNIHGRLITEGTGKIAQFVPFDECNSLIVINNYGYWENNVDTYLGQDSVEYANSVNKHARAILTNYTGATIKNTKHLSVTDLVNNGTIYNTGNLVFYDNDWDWDNNFGTGHWSGNGIITGDGTGTVILEDYIRLIGVPVVQSTSGLIENQARVEIHVPFKVNGNVQNVGTFYAAGFEQVGGVIVTGNVDADLVVSGTFGVFNIAEDFNTRPDDNYLRGDRGLYGFLQVGGDLTTKTLLLDAMAYDRHMQTGSYLWENRPEGILVHGNLTTEKFESYGMGWFEGDSKVSGELIHAYNDGFWVIDPDAPGLYYPEEADLTQLTLAFKNLEAGSIKNGGIITVSDNLSIGENSINEGTLNLNNLNLNGALANTGATTVTGSLSFGASGQFNQTTGSLTTPIGNIFTGIDSRDKQVLSTVSLDAQMSEDVRSTLTNLFSNYVAGNLTEDIINHASFTGGKVVVTGVNLTTTQRDDLTKAFKEAFLSGFTPQINRDVLTQSL